MLRLLVVVVVKLLLGELCLYYVVSVIFLAGPYNYTCQTIFVLVATVMPHYPCPQKRR